MAEQNLEHISFMMIGSFEITIGRTLLPDEIEYIQAATKNVFDQYSVLFDRIDIKFEKAADKKQIDEIIKKFMKRLTKLMTHYIFSRTEAYILSKEINRLRGLLPDEKK